MGLEKFPHPSLYMGIPVVSYCCRGDGSGEFIPDGDLPIANTTAKCQPSWLDFRHVCGKVSREPREEKGENDGRALFI